MGVNVGVVLTSAGRRIVSVTLAWIRPDHYLELHRNGCTPPNLPAGKHPVSIEIKEDLQNFWLTQSNHRRIGLNQTSSSLSEK
jgi:hypothetical protein